ncbi:MAG: hypothetical protein ACOCM4_09595 [Acetivibrio ethanolgignens]
MLTEEKKKKAYELAKKLSKLSESSLIIAESNIRVLEARDAMDRQVKNTA